MDALPAASGQSSFAGLWRLGLKRPSPDSGQRSNPDAGRRSSCQSPGDVAQWNWYSPRGIGAPRSAAGAVFTAFDVAGFASSRLAIPMDSVDSFPDVLRGRALAFSTPWDSPESRPSSHRCSSIGAVSATGKPEPGESRSQPRVGSTAGNSIFRTQSRTASG